MIRKDLVFVLALLFVGAGFLPATVSIKSVEKINVVTNLISIGTSTVDNEGDGDYTRIQDAIDHANLGDTIEVYSGTYVENVVVDKMLNLLGVDSELGGGLDTGNPIIDGSGMGTVVKTTSDGVKIADFTIRNSGSSDAGIHLSSHYNTIEYNVITKNFYGLKLFPSTGNQIIHNCIVDNDGDGLCLSHSHENTITNNTISQNGNCGIMLNFSSLSNTVNSNTISGNECGIYINETSMGNSISYNDFINNILNAFAPSGDSNLFDDGQKGNYWSDYIDVDENEDGIWDHPYEIPGGNGRDMFPLVNPVGTNHPPDTPSKPSGPTSGKPGIKYTFSSSSTDPDGDQLFYKWDWGDGSYSDWLGSYSSVETSSATHVWSKGSYSIRVKAKDIYDTESNWSEPLIIVIDDDPPKVEILKPEKGLYIKNMKIRKRLFRRPLILGDIDVTVDAFDDSSGIDRVEFYIDGKLKASDADSPYVYSWTRDKIGLFRHGHILKVVAYDDAGNHASDRTVVRKFF